MKGTIFQQEFSKRIDPIFLFIFYILLFIFYDMWILSEFFKCVLGETSEADEVDTKAY